MKENTLGHRIARNRAWFEASVRKHRAAGMNDDFVARQIVDDHFRETGESAHHRQYVVEYLVKGVRR